VTAAIATTGLSKNFGRHTAVDSIDLTVPEGSVYGFLGPNGSGKTTTIRMLLGLVAPTEGSFELLGRAMPHHANAVLSQVGALVEGPAFHPYLSGRDNLLRLDAADRTVPGRGARQRIAEALDRVGLGAAAGKRYRAYSLGMRQRLGLAAALLRPRELIVLDEPTNGLDPQGMAAMRDLIRDLGTGERTVVLSSHLLGEVEQVCDRAAVIHRGRLVAEGPVSELRGGARVRIVAEPVEQARSVAAEFGDVTVDSDGVLRVAADPSRIPELNARLVGAGVRVVELRSEQQSLEQVFLDLTGGETV
jgi:ABC-type multidrug transport system ATPase subunit